MPGVITNQSTVSPSSRPAPSEARWFAVGLTDHGPVNVAVRVRSIVQFLATFGPQVAYSALYSQLLAFFGEGGYEAWIARVVGPSAVKATISLDSGKLVVTARQPGAFANGWTAAYTSASKTLTLVAGTVTETYVGTDLADLLAKANQSDLIEVTSSGTLPASNVAATALASGTDDRGNITDAEIAAALDLFEYEQGRGAVSAPGWGIAVAGEVLAAHAAANGRIVITAGDRTDSLADLNDDADDLVTASDGRVLPFWPWVQIPTGATISPEGAIAGKRAANIRDRGVWIAPAGGNGALTYVTGLDQSATTADVNTAHDDHAVNAVRLVAGVPTVWGWRAIGDDSTYRYGTVRDVENRVRQDLEAALAQFVYAPATETTRQSALGTTQGVLMALASAGAFEPMKDDDGTELDPGWGAESGISFPDADVPSIAVLGVNAQFRPVGTADTVQLGLVTVPLGTALTA